MARTYLNVFQRIRLFTRHSRVEGNGTCPSPFWHVFSAENRGTQGCSKQPSHGTQEYATIVSPAWVAVQRRLVRGTGRKQLTVRVRGDTLNSRAERPIGGGLA